MGRAPCCDKAHVKRGPWSPEEDAKLKAHIEEHGTGGNWIALPHKIGLKRCGKSCRLRWLNYLRPNLKHGGFSEEEDNIICRLYISIGSRWSVIAAQLPGRTDNDIKNYWNTKLKKRLLGRSRGRPSESQHQEVADGKGLDTSSQALSSSAIERMKLHIQLQGLHGPFSFYNNPLLWPKFHPLKGVIDQSQCSNGNAAVTAQRACDDTAIEPFRDRVLPSDPGLSNWMGGSTNGFASHSSNVDFSTRQSNSKLDSAEAWIQAELQGLIYNESGCFVGEEDCRPSELFCFREDDGEDGSMNQWASNFFEDISAANSSDSASAVDPDSMFQ